MIPERPVKKFLSIFGSSRVTKEGSMVTCHHGRRISDNLAQNDENAHSSVFQSLQ